MRVSYTIARRLEILEFYRQHRISKTCIHFGVSRSMVSDWKRQEETFKVCPRSRRSLRRGKPRYVDLEKKTQEMDSRETILKQKSAGP